MSLKNFIALLISIIFISGALFYTYSDSVAKFLWQKYQIADLALALDKSDANLAMQIGNYHFNNGAYDLDTALKAYEKAVSIEPGILWGHYQLARIHFVKDESNRALDEINKELEYNPENLRSLYVRGLIYGYRGYAGDLEKAEADFRGFTEWSPSEWAGYNDLAWILEKEKKYKEAEDALQTAFSKAQDAENNPWLWNALGVAQMNQKKYIDAEKSFLKAQELTLKLTPSDFSKSYPGNDPTSAVSGLEAFKKAIVRNLETTINKLNP